MSKEWFVDESARPGAADLAHPRLENTAVANGTPITPPQANLHHDGDRLPASDQPNGRFDPVFGLPERSHEPSLPSMAVRDDGWQDTTPHPWRRYFARMIDVTGVGMALWAVIGLLIAAASPQWHERVFQSALVNNLLVSAILTCVITWPVNAFITGLTGTSIGKWLFGVRITDREGRPIGIAKALRREADALIYGLGLGIPVVVLFTAYTGYNTLKDHGETTWDERRPWVVTHRPSGALQFVFGLLGTILWLVIAVTLQALKGSP